MYCICDFSNSTPPRTVIEFDSPAMADMNGAAIFFTAVGRFCLMFFASAAIGVAFGLVSAMISFLVQTRTCFFMYVG